VARFGGLSIAGARRAPFAFLAILLLAPTWVGATASAPALAGTTADTPAPAPINAPTVIYRCTAAGGAVALQDDPCPAGQREQRREIAAFAAPAPVAAPAADAVSTADAAPDGGADPSMMIGPAEPEEALSRPLSMPPPLWRCTDLNGASRFADEYDPQPRCVPLSVLGIDLSRAPPSAAGLCRTVEDECVELGGDAACAAWQERLVAAESALRHSFSSEAAMRRAERDRAKAVVEGDCRP
jgi:hypothetical protein